MGNLRTALVAWLFSRSAAARLLLRVDDLDPDRVRPGIEERQLRDLRSLGIDWDGEPVRQTERLESYERALRRLADDDHAYACFCSRADIRAAASAPHADGPQLAYPGTCAQLDAATVAARVAAGEPHCLRVRAGGATFEVVDELRGRITTTVDDFVVRRKDGVAAYNLATVVDDDELGVGIVVRGADLLDSAPRQAWLAARLGVASPRWAHVPLLLGPDGTRLAKRHGSVTLADLRGHGIGPDEVRALLARTLGLAAPGEVPTPDQLVARFEPALLPTRDEVFVAPADAAG